jgi:predicted transcriptional regulator
MYNKNMKYISIQDVTALKTATKNESCNKVIDDIANNLNNKIKDHEAAEQYVNKIINELIKKNILATDNLNQIHAGDNFAKSFELYVRDKKRNNIPTLTTIEHIRNIINSVRDKIDKQRTIKLEESIDTSI